MAKKTSGRAGGKAKKTAAPKKQRERKPPKTAEQLSDEQRQALLFSYKRKIKPLLVTEKNAKAAVTQTYEMAKKEGIPKIELKIAMALESEEGEEKISSEFERFARVARWMGVKIGTQLDMFAGKQTQAEQHYADGKRAALDDLPAKPPSHLGQAAAEHWLSGHAEGRKALNTERAEGFKPLGEHVADLAEKAGIAASLNLNEGTPAVN